jgi:carboxyl-terminal processing protease
MAIDQAQLLLKGNPGTTVKISAIRRGKAEPQDIDITLAKLAPPKLVEDRVAGDIAYLHVPQFNAGTTAQIKDALAQFQQKGAKKLILDLRDCALGEEAEGISTAQLFVQSGTITTLKGQTVAPVVYSADPAKVAWSLPVAVLIGNGTAGPAEIVASAIADNKRGETIGERTYGIASQQKLIEMDNGSALILTTALYYSPGGKNIPAEGIAPTQEVHLSIDALMAMNDVLAPTPPPSASTDDADMKKAIEILQSGVAPVKKAA